MATQEIRKKGGMLFSPREEALVDLSEEVTAIALEMGFQNLDEAVVKINRAFEVRGLNLEKLEEA